MAKKKERAPSSNVESDQNPKPSTDEKKTLIILSFPIVVLFNIIKSLLFECFVLFKFLFNSSVQVLKSRQKDELPIPQTTSVTSKLVDDEIRIEAGDDIFRVQKYHHKRAFEFISKALKIDETTIQYPGKMLIDLTFSLLYAIYSLLCSKKPGACVFISCLSFLLSLAFTNNKCYYVVWGSERM